MPNNWWQEFLRVDSNKTELFHFLAELRINDMHDKEVLVTYDENVRRCVVGSTVDVSTVDPCTQ